jgi:hypothetical protein
MDYQTAKDIRGRSLTSMITTKMLAGGGVLGSTRSALSQKMRAKATGVKEKFDPMNIARFMTGGSRFATVGIGRLTGRSQRDIEYFAGAPKRRTYSKVDKTPPPSLNASSGDVLNQMFDFFKRMDERDVKRYETERAFREEKEIESERRHKEFISVLKNFLDTDGAVKEIKKEEEQKGDGLFTKLGSILSTMFSTFKDLVSSISSLLKGLLKPIMLAIRGALSLLFRGLMSLSKSLFGLLLKSLGWITNTLFPFLTRLLPLLGKIGLVIGIPLALIYAGRKALEYIARNMTDFSKLTPQEARNVLENGSQRDIEKQGGYEKLVEIASRDALYMTGDEQGYRPPTREEIAGRVPERVPPLSQFTREKTGAKRAAAERDWFANYGETHDPQTGLRKDLVDFVGPLKTDSKTGRLMSELSMSPEDRENISAMTRSPEESVTPYLKPEPSVSTDLGDLLLQHSADLARERAFKTGGASSSPMMSPFINRSNNVPLPDAPDPKAADTRNRTRIFQKTIEKNLSPI